MSAALVESVRLAYAELHGLCDGSRKFTMSVPVRPDRDSDMVIGRGLDAASAALTEAEALRAQIAASQAREAALREALGDAVRDSGLIGWEHNAVKALCAPTDTAALRAMLERAASEGWAGGNDYAFPDETPDAPMVLSALPLDVQEHIAAIVDRVLGSS